MTKRQRNYATLLAIAKGLSHRLLKTVKVVETKGSKRWTPFEGVPVSVFVTDLDKKEMS